VSVGVVVGYRAEADCLSPDLRVLCSGADFERARLAARSLHDAGATALVSFGLAGGLAPDLASGDLLLPKTVLLPGGALAVASAWRGRLAAALQDAGFSVRGGPIASSERIVATATAKLALRAGTGAVAVDMESSAVAEVATELGLPFLVLRAIADRSDQSVPRAAGTAIDPDGEVRHLAVLRALLVRPWELGALIALGRGSSRGLAALRRVAALAPDLGFGFVG
jgi:hopanoid-associated phosphorylase